MPTVEEVYREAWGKVGGVGRLRRTFSLFAEFWEMLEFQIIRRIPNLADASSTVGCEANVFVRLGSSTPARSDGTKSHACP